MLLCLVVKVSSCGLWFFSNIFIEFLDFRDCYTLENETIISDLARLYLALVVSRESLKRWFVRKNYAIKYAWFGFETMVSFLNFCVTMACLGEYFLFFQPYLILLYKYDFFVFNICDFDQAVTTLAERMNESRWAVKILAMHS